MANNVVGMMIAMVLEMEMEMVMVMETYRGYGDGEGLFRDSGGFECTNVAGNGNGNGNILKLW